MQSLLAQAFLLGLSVGPACLGYCAPVCVPCVASESRAGWKAAARVLALFLLGRLVGYTLVGLAAGLAGTRMPKDLSPRFPAGVQLVLGVVLLVFALFANRRRSSACTPLFRDRSGSFAPVMGLLTGLNLCPPFAAAIVGAAASPSTVHAVAYFWAFFAGTALFFVPLVLFGRLPRTEALWQVSRVCLLLAGGWFVLEGLLGIL